jgi:hypothetical protein
VLERERGRPPPPPRTMDNSLSQAESYVGSGITFDRLDQIFDLQRLFGPVIAYKILLEIAINAEDVKERRQAASKLLDATSEEPEKIASRLRESIFSSLSLAELEAMVQTGVTDPELAVEKLKSGTSGS